MKNSPHYLTLVSIFFLWVGLGFANATHARMRSFNYSATENETRSEDFTVESALELLKKAVAALDGKGQVDQLREVFRIQMQHRKIDDAVVTMNAILNDPNQTDGLFEATQGIYYDAKKHRKQTYRDLIRLVEHPKLEISEKRRLYRSDSLRNSIIHVLVQTPSLEEAEYHAKQFAFDPATLTPDDEDYNPLGIHLINGWQKITSVYFDRGDYHRVIEISKSFSDPKIRRKMMLDIGSRISEIESQPQRERLLALYNDSVPEEKVKARIQRTSISDLIKKGQLDQAYRELLKLESFENYRDSDRGLKLVRAFLAAGKPNSAQSLLEKICLTASDSTSTLDFANVFIKAGRGDLAIKKFGPKKLSLTESNPYIARYHQPLFYLVQSAVESGDYPNAVRYTEAIEEPSWRSDAYEILIGIRDPSVRMQRYQWLEKAISDIQKIKNTRQADYKLKYLLEYQTPGDSMSKDDMLRLIKSPEIRAELLARWLSRWIEEETFPENETDQLLQEIHESHPAALETIVADFVEKEDEENAKKALRLYRHDSDFSAFIFQRAFTLIAPISSVEELVAISRSQPPEHQGRVMYYAMRQLSPKNQARFADAVIDKIAETEIDLRFTNRMLWIYSQEPDLEKLKLILDLDLPVDQFRYDEPEHNAWPAYAQRLNEKIGSKRLVEFALTLENPTTRAITHTIGIGASLQNVDVRRPEFETLLRQVETLEDPVCRGHGLLRLAEKILAAKKK